MRPKSINRVFLMILCLYLIGSSVLGFFLPAFLSSSAGAVLAAQGLILAGTLAGCRLLRICDPSYLRLVPVRPAAVLCAMACTITFYPFLAAISELMQLFVSSGTQQLDEGLRSGNLLFNLLLYALLPACIEELMNRGLLYCAYRDAIGARKAVILSSLLFGLFHMNLDQFAYTFVFGIFLCLVLEASDSLAVCIACHFTLNAVSVLAIRFAADSAGTTALFFTGTQMSILQIASAGMILVISGAASLLLFRGTAFLCGREEAVREIFSDRYGQTRNHQKTVSAELILSIGLCILYMAAYEFVM